VTVLVLGTMAVSETGLEVAPEATAALLTVSVAAAETEVATKLRLETEKGTEIEYTVVAAEKAAGEKICAGTAAREARSLLVSLARVTVTR
jgi:hypothetical protein